MIGVPKRPGEPECTWADISKITSQLGWKPRISFESGVATMLDNISYWDEAPVWDPDSIESATKTWFASVSNATTSESNV